MHRKHHIINKKSLRGIRPRHCPPSPRGVKYIVVTQDTSSTLCSERRDEYLFGRTKTGGLGQVSTKTKHEKKILATEVKKQDSQIHWPHMYISGTVICFKGCYSRVVVSVICIYI